MICDFKVIQSRQDTYLKKRAIKSVNVKAGAREHFSSSLSMK